MNVSRPRGLDRLLQRYQVGLYLGAALLGLGAGTTAPAIAPALGTVLWPVLALLLYATFLPVPLARLPSAFREGRFLAAVLVGNFLLVPPVVWGLSRFLPPERPIVLGALMVLLVPCTDWFITFAWLGRGDARLAIVATSGWRASRPMSRPRPRDNCTCSRWCSIPRTAVFASATSGRSSRHSSTRSTSSTRWPAVAAGGRRVAPEGAVPGVRSPTTRSTTAAPSCWRSIGRSAGPLPASGNGRADRRVKSWRSSANGSSTRGAASTGRRARPSADRVRSPRPTGVRMFDSPRHGVKHTSTQDRVNGGP
jgi:hypothetical protein